MCFYCRSGGSLWEAPNASQSRSFHSRKRILHLRKQHPPAVVCGSTPVTSASPSQPRPPSTLLAGSFTWCTTILQRPGKKAGFRAAHFFLFFFSVKMKATQFVFCFVFYSSFLQTGGKPPLQFVCQRNDSQTIRAFKKTV